ncbi:acid phosphatase/Vanadium-dependent haloperoxidase [Ascodesmis nigricans]|uniref:Acid phosphatase/Vanadium-dependent haloperoxidase n=1 Tax=Ascodesmis nigricans TaxID=341454 RepID=A0A4S2MWK5_9PEZI|nr:acid phosphatase/Vanadium-dependent haloperoxidase [Ascodesmis nigricans]
MAFPQPPHPPLRPRLDHHHVRPPSPPLFSSLTSPSGTIAFSGSMSFWATPTSRPFSLTNPSISYPFTTSTKIPTWLLVILAALIPGLIIAASTLLSPRRDWRRKLYSWNTAWLGLGLAIAAAMLVTDGLKNLLGKPRPDLLSRCWPDEELVGRARIGWEGGGLVTREVCRGSPKLEGGVKKFEGRDLEDGFRSFPSGHASMSFAGLTYLSIFLAEYLFSLPLPHLSSPLSFPIARNPSHYNNHHHSRSRPRSSHPPTSTDLLPRFPIMTAILLCSIPVLLAFYISATRYSDFRHHPVDIVAGAGIGVVAAVMGWRWYGGWCCVVGSGEGVYMLRRGGGGGGKVRDEEEGERKGRDGEEGEGRKRRRRGARREMEMTWSGDTVAEEGREGGVVRDRESGREREREEGRERRNGNVRAD